MVIHSSSVRLWFPRWKDPIISLLCIHWHSLTPSSLLSRLHSRGETHWNLLNNSITSSQSKGGALYRGQGAAEKSKAINFHKSSHLSILCVHVNIFSVWLSVSLIVITCLSLPLLPILYLICKHRHFPQLTPIFCYEIRGRKTTVCLCGNYSLLIECQMLLPVCFVNIADSSLTPS